MTTSARTGTGRGPSGADYDALADLFLGEGLPEQRGEGSRRGSEPRHATVEQIVVGHLPVSPWAWVRQYARQMAEASGRGAALVRVERGRVTIESAGVAEVRGEGTLEGTIRSLASRVGAWLVSVPDGAGLIGADAVTVLTGADEASVVGSYRALRDLVASDGAVAVRMAIMGASAERAGEASSRLARAAEAFLGRPISLAAIVQRISGTTPGAVVYEGSATGDPGEEARRIVGLVRTTSRVEPRHGPASEPRGGWIGEGDEDRASAVAKYAAAMRHVREAVSEQVEPRMESKVASEPEKPGARTGDGSVAALLGLTVVPIRCPVSPMVDIAVDSAGEVHLAVLAGEAGDRAVVDVLAAADWARANAGVLAMALRSVGIAADPQRATMHVVTERAGDARRLEVGGVRTHLAIRVEVEGRTVRKIVSAG